MFVGHSLLAFALVAGLAVLSGRVDDQRALRLGVVAGAFAALPDVDMLYALVGLAGVDGGVLALATSFWVASTVVHRAVTHSLVVGPAVAVAVGLWTHARRAGSDGSPTGVDEGSAAGASTAADGGRLAVGRRWPRRVPFDPTVGDAVLLAIVLALTAAAALASGALGAVVMALFVLGAVALAEGSRRWLDAGPATVAGLAFAGLFTHPFGDLTTGTPPELLYPMDATLLAGRVTLSADPTLHLLGAFALELATVWVALAVAFHLRDRSLVAAIRPRAVVGVAYAVAAVAVPAPTLELSYPFVFSVLAVGTVGATPWPRGRRRRVPSAAVAVVTGLAAVTVALAAYTAVYVAVL